MVIVHERTEPNHGYPATPAQHAQMLHPVSRPGHVAVALKLGPKKWYERAYPVSQLSDVLSGYEGYDDVYLSTQRFWGWRRIAQLAECGALAVDVDFHKVPELAGRPALGILEDCLVALDRAQKPHPSVAIASGRGLYLKWLHEPVPRQALPRWNACQRELWEVLKPLGADRGALDAARVLRVVGSRHSKAGVIVESLRGPGEVWEFDTLADEVLPVTRAELHDLRIQRAARDARKPVEQRRVLPQRFPAASLWEARLRDLQTLRDIRWFGDLPPGQRDHWMFLAGNAMSWLAVPEVLQRELYALAREAAGWGDQESKSRMHAIFKRSHMAAKGQKIEWMGKEVDPRYRFKTQTILELLEITAEEERQMRTLFGEDEKRRRFVAAGGMGRRQYEGRAEQRRLEARRMSSEGKSFKEISEALGVSVHTVNSYVYGRR